MAPAAKRILFRTARRIHGGRLEGQRAEVYYGRPVKDWPPSWML